MLKKVSDFEIDSNKPFANDKLGRELIEVNLTNLIKTLTQPFVLSINSPWGTGKTVFLKMWEAKLRKESFTCLYFNAWENDFSDDPFISFIGEIESHIELGLIGSDSKEKYKVQINKIKKMGGQLLRRTTPLAVKLATLGTISNLDEIADIFTTNADEAVSDLISKIAEDKINEYKQKKKSRKAFKENLEKFVAEIGVKGNQYPVVFFIDELDRCRPNYAVELLESVKHLFSVEGIVFVLAIDRHQIEQSIKSMYGVEMDSDGYLRRFIDLNFNLPNPPKNNYHRFLFEKFEIEKQFIDRGKPYHSDDLLKSFGKLSEVFNLSLRVQEQCMTQINLVIRTTSYTTRFDSVYLTFLVTLKAKEPGLYLSFNERKIDSDQLIKSLASKYDWQKLNEGDFDIENIILAGLESAYLSSSNVNKLINRYDKESQNDKLSTADREKYERISDLMITLREVHELLVRKIEISERFQAQ